jgi:hypothetical protein
MMPGTQQPQIVSVIGANYELVVKAVFKGLFQGNRCLVQSEVIHPHGTVT